MRFYLSFDAVWGPVDARLDFTVRKMSSFDVRSSDVWLNWNLTGSLLESFWDDPLAPIWMPWSRGAPPLVGLILIRSVKARSNVVGMTWNLTCSPLEACRRDSCTLFDEWRHRGFSPPRGLISQFESWWRVKRCRFDLKFDVEPFGGILRPSIGSNWRFDIFDTIAPASSCSAIGGLKLGQMVSKWPETSCVPLFWLFCRILQFLFDFD